MLLGLSEAVNSSSKDRAKLVINWKCKVTTKARKYATGLLENATITCPRGIHIAREPYEFWTVFKIASLLQCSLKDIAERKTNPHETEFSVDKQLVCVELVWKMYMRFWKIYTEKHSFSKYARN